MTTIEEGWIIPQGMRKIDITRIVRHNVTVFIQQSISADWEVVFLGRPISFQWTSQTRERVMCFKVRVLNVGLLGVRRDTGEVFVIKFSRNFDRSLLREEIR